ncbi:hypothetical protein TNCV_1749871 [Trichonephila clavipes]|nr:hypothetical protein TNCV_1749871 [Trichonephila clavipes]
MRVANYPSQSVPSMSYWVGDLGWLKESGEYPHLPEIRQPDELKVASRYPPKKRNLGQLHPRKVKHRASKPYSYTLQCLFQRHGPSNGMSSWITGLPQPQWLISRRAVPSSEITVSITDPRLISEENPLIHAP